MAMLDELLAQLRNPNQTPWQKQMLGQMMGGPFSPSPTNYGEQMGAPSPVAPPQAPAPMGLGGMAQPQQMPAQAPPRQPVARFPSPGEGTQDNSPPGPSLGTYVSGALAGASQASNPIGMLLGALGGGMAAGQDVENKRGTYQALADAGMDPAQASLAIKNPDAFKMTQAIREKQAAQRQAADETNRTVRFLMTKPGMTEEQARTIAGNPAALVPYLKPQPGPGSFVGPENFKVVDGRLVQITPTGPQDVTPDRPRTKFQDKVDLEMFKADVGTATDYRKYADDAKSLTDKLDRLEAARSMSGREGPISAMLPSYSAPAQNVDSAAVEIQLEFTKQTKGAITEREMGLFKSATPGWQMTDEAARPVIDAMRAAADRSKERAKFFDAWLRTHQTLDGAMGAWDGFMKENPIIEQDQTGKFKVRPENVKGWERYLSGAPRSPVGGAAPIDAAAPVASASGKSRIIGVE